MAKGRIFFTEEVQPYFTHGGKVRVSPIQATLEDGTKGYFLGDDWDSEIKTKGASTQSVLRTEILENSPIWSELPNGHQFSIGDKVIETKQSGRELEFYRCIQAHRKQSDWIPSNVPALFSKIQIKGDIEVWSQPTGGDGKYPFLDPNTGNPYRVSDNGFIWENNFQGGLNVWPPGVFGWTQIGPV